MEDRAAKIGGRHLMNDDAWEQSVLRGIADPNTKISVALDDVVGSTPYNQVMSSVQRGMGIRSGSPFDWEMRQLYEARELGNVDFWLGGARVENPFR